VVLHAWEDQAEGGVQFPSVADVDDGVPAVAGRSG
jgi:hypothetical protein